MKYSLTLFYRQCTMNDEYMKTIETLYDPHAGSELPLPSELTALYGSLGFASHPGHPYVFSNFVSTLDGVVSLDAPGNAVGDVMSGSNQEDSLVMGLLRAVSFVTHHSINEGNFSMKLTKNLGMLLLAIWLIATGLIPLLSLSFSGLGTIMAILAVAAGVLIGLGR